MTADRSPRDLWRVQLALECKAFDDAGRLVVAAGPNPDPLHACYAVRYSDRTTETAFAAAAPDLLVRQVGRIGVDELVDHRDDLVERLEASGFRVTTDQFRTYCFEDDGPVLTPPTLVRDGAESFSILVDGRRVASASSSRSDSAAAELWIETAADQRRLGYGTLVAKAWAAEVLQSGKIAFYSHLHDNLASAALAGKLGVRPLFEIVALNAEPSPPGRERGFHGIGAG